MSRKEQKRVEAEARQARSKERRELQRQVKALEDEITRLEAEEKRLVAELELPETYNTPGRAMAVNRELQHLHVRLPALHEEWAKEAERLQGMKD